MASPTSPYPYDFLDETMRTLSLLLPPVLGAPNSFLLRAAKKHALDASMGNCRRLNSSERHIDRFVYWRDRLVSRTVRSMVAGKVWHPDSVTGLFYQRRCFDEGYADYDFRSC